MTMGEAVIWLINIAADIGKAEHRDLWHYEQALCEIREMLESAQPDIIRCKDCKHNSNTGGNYTNCDVLPQMFGRNPEDNYCSYAERREE